MNRGCLIAATLVAAAVLVCACLLHFHFLPRKLRYDTSWMAMKLEEGLAAYRADFGGEPAGGEAEVLRALLGENARNRPYIDPQFGRQTDAAGRATDVWKHAFRLEPGPEGLTRVVSPGRNGRFGDADDVDSTTARQILRQALPPAPAPSAPAIP